MSQVQNTKKFYLQLDNSPNIEWHKKHQPPEDPTLAQRITFHIEHARRCPCSLNDNDILPELKKRYLGRHQDFWIEYNTNEHRVLGLWAAVCAEHVLPYFEEKYGDDTRPRNAIKTLREWGKTGEFHMSAIRAAALPAHAAAKLVDQKDKAAIYAAHAAGQAVSTAHAPTHAVGTIAYSMKIAAVLNPNNVKEAAANEREWQNERLPEKLRPWIDAWVERITALLPKDLRTQLK
jgi:hypothetical protein